MEVINSVLAGLRSSEKLLRYMGTIHCQLNATEDWVGAISADHKLFSTDGFT